MNLVECVLAERHDELGLADVGLGRRMQTALLTPRFVTSRHVVALVFAPGDPRPRAVAKMPRRPGDNGGVHREAEMLRQLAARLGRPPAGVPAVLGTVHVGGLTLLVETVVTGVALDPRRVQRDRGAAVSAGASFIASLPVTRSAADNVDWYDAALTRPLAKFAERLPMGAEAADLCRRTHALLEPLRATHLPSVFEHGDLSHPNLFLSADEGTLGVVDWERSTTDGVPGHDFVFFLQYVSESVRSGFTRPAQLAAFDDAFLGPDPWASRALRDHVVGRGVDPALLAPLVVASWARSAATLVSRLVPEDGAQDHPPAGALDRAVTGDRDVTLWRHAVEQAERGRLA